MGRIIAETVKGMNWKAKISLILIFTLVFSTFMYQGWYGPKPAQAAIAFGNAGATANGTASLSVPYPLVIAAGDLLVLGISNKYPTNGPSTPAGWTLVANGQGSGGAGAQFPDSGNVYSTVFVREAVGTESGNVTVTLTSANSSIGMILRYTKAAGTTWSYAATNGSDNTSGTGWSVTGAANPGITVGDMLVVVSAANQNGQSTYSAETVTATSATIAAGNERQDGGTNQGDDSYLVVSDHSVTAGTATAAPVYTMTGTGNSAGASVILRLREVSAGSLQFSSATYSVAENAGSASVTVSRTGGSSGAVSVTCATVAGGTATAGTDYTTTSTVLNWADGDTANKTCSIPITNDALDEANETVNLQLSGATGGATIGAQSTATLTITDDDPTPTVAFALASSSGSEATTPALMAVNLSAASGQTVTVNYSVGGTATGSGTDYTLAAGTLTFNPGVTTQNISAAIINDALDENNETIIVTLASPANATLGAQTAHTYTINDDDPTPTVAFAAASSSGSEATTPALMAVNLSAASGLTVTVNYSVTGGTATGVGVDYTLAAGTLTFNPGVTTQNISATIVDDAGTEVNETIIVTLAGPANATLGAQTAHTYTINDNDATAGTLQFTGASFSVNENAGPASVTVSRTGGSAGAVSVTCATVAGGTATAGTDYTTTSTVLNWANGDTANKTCSIPITNDALDETNETVNLQLSGATGGATIGAQSTAVLTITDDDPTPTVAFALASSSGSEATTPALMAVDLSAASGQTVTVNYSVTGGTATGVGVDYTLAAGTLTFNPGVTTQNISAAIVNDVLVEANETIIVTLASPANATLGAQTAHTYTINDDEVACTVNIPTLSIAPSSDFVDAGDSAAYTVSVTNNDAGAGCSNVTFNLVIVSDSNPTDFTIPSTLAPASLILANGATGTSTLTVTSKGTAGMGTQNITTVSVNAAGHAAPANVAATTTVGSPMAHNSVTTGSTKHGGWGISGKIYGPIVCITCHSTSTSNIKRVKDIVITGPNGTDQFPAQAAVPQRAPIFNDARNGSSDFGDDARADKSYSTNVCEVCHTYDASQANGVKFHAFNMTAGGADTTHNNKFDCTDCHKHNAGFKAPACDSCHGNPPGALASSPHTTGSVTAGAHVKHATDLGFPCANCHNAYTMPQKSSINTGLISMGFSKFGSTDGTYSGQLNVKYSLNGGPEYGGDGTKTCSSVYCHGGTIGGTNPVWDGTAACGSCHGATAATPPTLGSHVQHAGSAAGNYSLNCSVCHPNVTDPTHLTGDVAWSISTTDPRSNGGIYKGFAAGSTGALAPSGTYGSCATLYCHGNFGGNGNNATPTWGVAASGDCGTCHDVDTSVTMSGGSHDKHIHGGLSITCDYCHEGTAQSAAGGIQSTTQHVNGSLNWNLLRTQNRVGATATYRTTETGTIATASVGAGPYGQCNNIYCHSNVQTTPPGAALTFRQPTWGGTVTCGDCHKTGPFGPGAEQDSGSHLKHVSAAQYNITCSKCHQGAGSGTINHANYQVNVAIDASYGASAAYNGTPAPGDAYGSCSNVYCHSSGQASNGGALTPGDYKTQVWGVTLGCGSCHKNMDADATAPGGHKQHAQDSGIACVLCHDTYTETTVNTATHVNQSINLSFSGAAAGTTYSQGATPGNGYGSCSTNSCHGAGSPTWGANTTNDTCTKCHGTPTAAGTISAVNREVVAPPVNTAGDTGALTGSSNVSSDPKVGAHQTHLLYTNGLRSTANDTKDDRCTWCHGNAFLTYNGLHANGSSTPQGNFSVLAVTGGMSPTYSGTTCTNTYCHNPAASGVLNPANNGTGVAPSWIDAAYISNAPLKTETNCNRCHKAPGTVAGTILVTSSQNHSTFTITTDCAACHEHNGETSGTAGRRHMDGIKYGGGDCNSCHSYDVNGATYTAGVWSGGTWNHATAQDGIGEGFGAHAVHINHIKTRLGIATALTAAGQTFGAGSVADSPAFVCGTCHTNTAGNHQAGGRMINFGDGTYRTGGAAGFSFLFDPAATAVLPATLPRPQYNGVSGASSSVNPKNCSAVGCHINTTPVWSIY